MPDIFTSLEDKVLLIGGIELSINIEHDDDHGPPWRENDGHGPVEETTRANKRPGEFLLHEDRGYKRFYDYQEACKIARRDGWGWLPGEPTWEQLPDGRYYAISRAGRDDCEGFYDALGDTVNEAIRGLYAKVEQRKTKRQIAALAARKDYEYLRGWCNDEWWYVGVVVQATAPDHEAKWDDVLADNSIWRVESHCEDYQLELANDMADEVIAAAYAALRDQAA